MGAIKGFIRIIQKMLLNKDIEKNRGELYLAKNYPMSMLVDAGAFKRYKNSELYCPTSSNYIFNANGEFLGNPKYFENAEESNYLVLTRENPKTFLSSVAVYDLNGDCVVPHDCYCYVYMAKDYAILTMPMDKEYVGSRAWREEKSTDKETFLTSTGKTLLETLGGSFSQPRVLVVGKDKIINTRYLSVEPLDIPQYNVAQLENNTIWIGQTENKEEITFKFDKRMRLLETYRLPYFSHEEEIFFATKLISKGIFYLDTEGKRRVNLRTGEYVDLMTLKKTKLSKAERFAELKQEDIQQDAILAVDDVVISLPQNATFEESSEIPPIADDEIGEYDPSLDV